MTEENASKHLEFIQGAITRMANNSFLLKGWTVTLVAALFALAAQNENDNFVFLAFFPIIAFWILDAYYLRQEKLFRKLYDDIRIKEESAIQIEGPFSMNTNPFDRKVQSWIGTMFSKTLVIFYGISITTVIIVIISITGKLR